MNIYNANHYQLSPGAQALMEWMQEGLAAGCHVYYLVFKFDHLHGPPNTVLQKMATAIDKVFYGPFCRSCAHHPGARGERHKLPELLLYPDLPVPKKDKTIKRSSDITANAGYHYNGPIRIPETSQFSEDLIEHVKANDSRYCKGGISEIWVESANRSLEKLADYVTKTVKRGWADPEEILVLPRSISERRNQPMRLNAYQRAIRDIQSEMNVSDEVAGQLYRDSIASERKRR